MNDDELRRRARALGLYGLLAHWDEIGNSDWVRQAIALEEEERARRSLERRLQNARIGRFKPMADFDWTWPKAIDREAVEELFKLAFVADVANVILVGPNDVATLCTPRYESGISAICESGTGVRGR